MTVGEVYLRFFYTAISKTTPPFIFQLRYFTDNYAIKLTCLTGSCLAGIVSEEYINRQSSDGTNQRDADLTS